MISEVEPLPETNSDTEPWWAATRERRLVVQHCRPCGHFQHYPRSLCTRCGSTDLEFVDASGRGSVYSFTAVHRPPTRAFKAPYVVALVRLEEGPTLLTHIVDSDPAEVRCEMAVEVTWAPLSDGRNLPMFRPVRR